LRSSTAKIDKLIQALNIIPSILLWDPQLNGIANEIEGIEEILQFSFEILAETPVQTLMEAWELKPSILLWDPPLGTQSHLDTQHQDPSILLWDPLWAWVGGVGGNCSILQFSFEILFKHITEVVVTADLSYTFNSPLRSSGKSVGDLPDVARPSILLWDPQVICD